MTIVNLRGINGSGKTTLAREVLEHRSFSVRGPAYVNKFGSKRTGWPAHVCETPVGTVIVHGRYDVQQGGCDTETDMDMVDLGLRSGFKEFPHAHHLFEGFIVSKSSKRFQKLAEDHKSMGRHFVILNPGLEECVRRVMERNGGKEPKRELMERSLNGDLLRCERDFRAMVWPRVSSFESLPRGKLWELF